MYTEITKLLRLPKKIFAMVPKSLQMVCITQSERPAVANLFDDTSQIVWAFDFYRILWSRPMIAVLINARCNICQQNNCVRAVPVWTSESTLDYDNRIDCLQVKLRTAVINSIWNRKIRKLCASKKYVRLLNDRNIRRRKMNDNVISVCENQTKNTTDLPNTRRVLPRLEIRKITDAPIIDLCSSINTKILFIRELFPH